MPYNNRSGATWRNWVWCKCPRWLAGALLSTALFVGNASAQNTNPPADPPPPTGLKAQQPPAAQYMLATLSAILILLIVCKPSRRVT